MHVQELLSTCTYTACVHGHEVYVHVRMRCTHEVHVNQYLKADGNAVASILVFELRVLGILLLPAFSGFIGVHNKVQLLGGVREVGAGLEIVT